MFCILFCAVYVSKHFKIQMNYTMSTNIICLLSLMVLGFWAINLRWRFRCAEANKMGHLPSGCFFLLTGTLKLLRVDCFCGSSFVFCYANLLYEIKIWCLINMIALIIRNLSGAVCIEVLTKFYKHLMKCIIWFQGVSSWFDREARSLVWSQFLAQWSIFHLNCFTLAFSSTQTSWTYHWFQVAGQTVFFGLSIFKSCIWGGINR